LSRKNVLFRTQSEIYVGRRQHKVAIAANKTVINYRQGSSALTSAKISEARSQSIDSRKLQRWKSTDRPSRVHSLSTVDTTLKKKRQESFLQLAAKLALLTVFDGSRDN
jgi:hypothetical protein